MAVIIIITIPPDIRAAVDVAMRELPGRMDSPEARVQIFAHGAQESRFEHRRQMVKRGRKIVPEGPAKSFWQGELTGGMCAGILRHPATAILTKALCERHGVPATAQGIWDAIERNDVLAAQCARLLLWTDPQPLPAIGDADGAWAYYLRTWRPGKPHPHTWGSCYEAAVKAVCP